MALSTEDKAKVVTDFGNGEGDTGSASVQVALITARIDYLTEHSKLHPQDHASRRGLLKLVGQRRRLLKFLRNTSEDQYRALIQRLGLRR
jgi:small subunit ribosomal protein S15